MTTNTKLLELFNKHELSKLEAALKENIREENVKNAGKASKASKILDNLVKHNKKEFKWRESFSKAHQFEYNNNTYYGFTDGHYILASKELYGYEVNTPDESIDMKKIFNIDTCYSFEVNREEIAIFAKEHKKNEQPYTIQLENGKYAAFNAKMLLDIIDFTGSNILKVEEIKSYNLRTPAIIEGVENIAVLLPVHIQDPQKCMEYMNNWRKLTA